MRRPVPTDRFEARSSAFSVRPALRLPVFLAATALLVMVGCEGGTDPDPHDSGIPSPDSAARVVEGELPSLWVFGASAMRSLSFSLELDEAYADRVLSGELEPPRVQLELDEVDGPGTVLVDLYDDGGAVQRADLPEYLAPQSGDLVPYDFRYTVRMNALFAEQEASYLARLLVTGRLQDSVDTAQHFDQYSLDTLHVQLSRPPRVVAFSMPDSLQAGFPAQSWVATVRDPDTVSASYEVVRVDFLLSNSAGTMRERLLGAQSDSTWSFEADSSFAAALPSGNYEVSILAHDSFGQSSLPYADSVWIENSAPVLTQLVAPDTVYEPASGVNLYFFYVDVMDRQSALDIESVRWEMLRPDSILNSDPAYVFYNDGSPPDELADDETWSFVLPLQRTEDPPNPTIFGSPYTFRAYAEDRAGNRSVVLEHEIIIMPEEGLTP